jgi:chemotaxis protein methyltransferase WspC
VDEADCWVLSEEIRRMVRFRAMNLLAPDALAGEAPYDVILCRNLLIYLTVEARVRLLGTFRQLLADDGIIVVGHAEALEVIDRRFQNIGVPSAFTYVMRAEEASGPVPAPAPRRPTPPGAPPIGAQRATPPAGVRIATPPAGVRIVEPAVPRDLLREARALADRGELADAATLVDQHLAQAGADAAGWALLGSIRQAGGDQSRAEECFSRAIYCDPAMYTALVQLALLLEKRGETKGAQQLRARAERAKAGRPR